MVVFLVGYMGCGKSSIGRAAARRLGWRFADMDREIEQECGMTVAEIFSEKGEAFFRAREREVLERLAAEDNILVATGGGVPCFGDNMKLMNKAGLTVYLKMTPEKLAARLKYGRMRRPLIRDLDDAGLLAFIEENLAVREKFYSQAGMTIDCHGVSDEYVSGHIVRHFENMNSDN